MTAESPNQRRLRTGEVAGITGVRLHPPGSPAQIVNISPTGLLAESAAKLRVGTTLQVEFEGGFTPHAVGGRVVRCEVAAMERDGILRYHIGIDFDAQLPLHAARGPEPAAPPPARDVRNRW